MRSLGQKALLNYPNPNWDKSWKRIRRLRKKHASEKQITTKSGSPRSPSKKGRVPGQ